MREIVAKKYVKALILALDASEFDRASDEFKKLASAFSIPKFNFIIDSPMIDAKSKVEFLLSLIDDSSNKKLGNFLLLLSQRQRLHLIPEISKEFEYQKAIRDAKSYAFEDNRKKEYIDIINDAESLVYKVEQGLENLKSGLDRSKKSEIKGNLRSLKKLVKKAKPDKVNDMQIGEIRQVKDNLENSAREII